ncbi:MAG: Pls/PosA family non-ribosomal peptide synthetase, partial [Nostocoides sp.]
LGVSGNTTDREVGRLRRRTQVGQMLSLVPLRTLAAARWSAWLMLGSRILHPWISWLPTPPWWSVALAVALFVLPPGRMAVAALLARFVLRGVVAGQHPRGGSAHLRIWLAGRIQDELAATSLAGAPWFPWYARILGCTIADGVDLHTVPPVTGLLTVGSRAAVESEVDLTGHWVDGDVLHVGTMTIGAGARVGARSMLGPGAEVGPDAEVAPGSYIDGRVPAGEFWSGSPAEPRTRARGPWPSEPPPAGRRWLGAYAALSLLLGALPLLALLAGGAVLWQPVTHATSAGAALLAVLPWLPLAGLVGFAVLLVSVLVAVRFLGLLIRPGHVPVRSARGVAVWGTIRVLDEARDWLFPLYSGALTPIWLRLLGATIGKDVEASTVLMIPKLTSVGDGAFLADDTLIGGYELSGGWMRVDDVKIGKRAFVGNSGMAAPGRKVRKASLVAVLSAAPRAADAKSGQSWLGSPPTRLRRVAEVADKGRTYQPSTRLKVLRGVVETMRVVPMLLAVLLNVVVALTLLSLLGKGVWVDALLGGVVLSIAGIVAALLSVAAKWILVGRHTVGEHPLWSGFVWRNELADTFTEFLAARWFVPTVLGTWALNVWLRMLGATIGHGVWCDTYWLPETDLVELGDGATVNAGTVVQTHLFHDRVLALDTVKVKAGATLGPNSVILPAASIGRFSTIGPGSLVMRGESVPSRTRWIGNPIGPWEES